MNTQLKNALTFHPELDRFCKLNKLTKRKRTRGIVLHHTAGDGSTPASVTRYHTQSRGWFHAGYNILITPDGKAHVLRPLEMIGAHAGVGGKSNEASYWNNRETVGIALSGAMHKHPPTDKAINKLLEIMGLLIKEYPDIGYIKGHNNMPGCATACPGKYMPMKRIVAEFDQIKIFGHSPEVPKPEVVPEITEYPQADKFRLITAPCSSLAEAKAAAKMAKKKGWKPYIKTMTIYMPQLVVNSTVEAAERNLEKAKADGLTSAFILPTK